MLTASLNTEKLPPESSELSSVELEADERVYVIVLNYKGWEVTIECVESVLRSTGVNVTVVICDNESPDGSMDKLRAWARGEQKPPDPANPSLASLSRPHAPKPLDFIELNR